MIYRFDNFDLDVAKAELRENGRVIPVEPQVFALLLILVQNAHRLISKDEIIEKVWNGRVVSDAALSSRIKTARKKLGDDGKTQRLIKTIHGKGIRFVGEVRIDGNVSTAQIHAHAQICPEETPSALSAVVTRPSIAVLPFESIGAAGPYAAIADALPHELIVELSRLRWLFVIARGSSFQFRGPNLNFAKIGASLGVRYCLTGSVEVTGRRLIVSAELNDLRDLEVIWADRIQAAIDDIFEVRLRMTANIVAALEIQIPLREARLARLTPPENLDAWGAYHLGLQHMFRFNERDNEQAKELFRSAVALEPGFARAHAGLSFVHFQDAFVHYTDDISKAVELARYNAEEAVALDPADPFANFTLGRAHLLEGDMTTAHELLDRAISLSPNYAQGIYTRAWTHTMLGNGAAGEDGANLAMALSPLDPFRYAMLGTRALAHLIRGELVQACEWADRAVRAPGAHVLITMIALMAHGLNGDSMKAGAYADEIRRRNPTVTQAEFFRSFPFQDAELLRQASNIFSRFGL